MVSGNMAFKMYVPDPVMTRRKVTRITKINKLSTNLFYDLPKYSIGQFSDERYYKNK